MKEESKKCWELNARPREACRKCSVYVSKVHYWEAPSLTPRPCIMNYHLCVERKCPAYKEHKDEIMRARRGTKGVNG
ncbi:hypothetical protein [Candidatus Oleimmundimicrobium sp.]|uniref:hypothetical protein n=1 Tax=Candidatus Oleimmundimicrobium sp. TaxID=3060597 RepID=UPI00272464BF|nr:hypothetical protein [Candidatus Oleimmundimicrobium sp.]MDO8885542.1 hypothetical protein [Candidatus Oleimmundimicrobium sp.]